MPDSKNFIFNAIKNSLDIKKNEDVLIITDRKLKKIAHTFLKQAKKVSRNVDLVETPIQKTHGTEPPKHIAKKMLKYDVIIMLTYDSLSHTDARRNATKNGARIVSMPAIKKATIKRCLDVDYNKIKFLNKKLMRQLKNGEHVNITTKKGTDLNFEIKGRKVFDDNGDYRKKGGFGNLPAGEVFISPLEGSANGRLVVDASIAGIGKLRNNLKFEIKDGYVKNISGKESLKLKKIIRGFGKKARNIAEFGIGTNYKAKVTGSTLEDEKAFNTIHIALGDNKSMGGKIGAKCHLDGIILNPDVFVDATKIIEKGKIIV